MRRLLLGTVLGLLLAAVPASAAPIIVNWSDVGTVTDLPAPGFDKVAIADFSGGGLGDVILSGPGVTPAVLQDSYMGEPGALTQLTQLVQPLAGAPAAGGRVAVGDLNGDKVPDVVEALSTGQRPGGSLSAVGACAIRWLLSTGPRSPTRPRYAVRELSDPTCRWGGARDVALGDADGDGDLDAFVSMGGSVAMFRNDGSGTLASPVFLGSGGAYLDRITLASLVSPGKYAAGAFVPPTVFASRPAGVGFGTITAPSTSTAAFIPAGGQTYQVLSLAAPNAVPTPPLAVSPTQVLTTSASAARLMSFSGTAFTALPPFNTLPDKFSDPLDECSPNAVGDHLVNTTSRTLAVPASTRNATTGAYSAAVHLFAQPVGETAVRDVRDITLAPSTNICAMAMAPLGATEGGAPDHLVVLTGGKSRDTGFGPTQLYIFHSLTSTNGTARAGGPSGPSARLVSRRVRAGRDGSVTLSFSCPKAARSPCPLQSALLPSTGTVAPYVVAAAIKPGRLRSFKVQLSPDATAKLKHGAILLRVRPVATGRPVRRVIVI